MAHKSVHVELPFIGQGLRRYREEKPPAYAFYKPPPNTGSGRFSSNKKDDSRSRGRQVFNVEAARMNVKVKSQICVAQQHDSKRLPGQVSEKRKKGSSE